MALQGLPHFGSINQESMISATYTAVHGISPGVCTLTVTPDTPIGIGGTLKFTFGSSSVTFPDCRADLATLQLSQDGFHWDIQILDRRWKWRFGEINGFYNRRDDRKNVITRSEKTPQELATLLLSAMGESGFDVSQIPNGPRPLMEWVSANPAEELARMCDELGCRIVLHLNNLVKLHRVGIGRNLLGVVPSLTMASGRGIDPPEKPDKIKVIAGPTLFQADLELEAVGLDTDGNIKPIDDLSYTPDGGWSLADSSGGFPQLLGQKEILERAKKTVFRWYRPKISASNPISIGTQGLSVTNSDQILPLFSEQVELFADSVTKEKLKKVKPAEVYGLFYRNGYLSNSIVDGYGTERWTNGFKIIGEIGVVEFPVPVRKKRFISLGQAIQDDYPEADLTLRTSFFYRFNLTEGEYHRASFTLITPPPLFGTGPEIVDKQDEIQLQEWQVETTWFSNRFIDNLDGRLSSYANAALFKYQLQDSGEDTYAGIVPTDLDGAIQQVTYTVGPDGAETQVSRNREANPFYPTFATRRRIESAKTAKKESRDGENSSIRERHEQKGVRV